MANYKGRELGGYRILEQIGRGGMAKVFKAYQPSFNRIVAIKLIPDLYQQDETAKTRFRQEAKIIANLEHNHIIPVYDFAGEGDTPFLVMRYLQAGNLKNLLAAAPNGKLELQDALIFTSQIASALDYAHSKGIVHRDVKPANILIDTLGRSYLTDFGIAKVLEGSQHLTKTGSTLGTPAYMSPEQATGKEVDHRSDIYSLGIILYQMLTGRPPFDADTPYATILAHLTEPLPLPSTINPTITQDVELVILKALARDPNNRFQSASSLANALKVAVDQSSPDVSSNQISPATLKLSTSVAGKRPSEDLTFDDLELIKEFTRERRKKKIIPWLLVFTLGAIIFGTWFAISQINASTTDPGTIALSTEYQNTSNLSQANPTTDEPENTESSISAEEIFLTPTPDSSLLNMRSQVYLGPVEEKMDIRLGKGTITNIKVNPARDKVAVGTPLGFYIYQHPSLDLLTYFKTDTWIVSLDWSHDSSKIAAGGRDGSISIWNTEQHREIQTLSGHEDWVRSVSWSNDDNYLLSGSNSGDILLWDLSTGISVERFTEHNSSIYSLAWSPADNQFASSSYDRTIKIWDADQMTLTNSIESQNNIVTSLSWSPAGETLASGSRDGTVSLWDPATGDLIYSSVGHEQDVCCLVWLDDEKYLASGSVDGKLIQWNETLDELSSTDIDNQSDLMNLGWDTHNQLIIGYTKEIGFKLEQDNYKATTELEGHLPSITSLGWSPIKDQIAFGTSENEVFLWNTALPDPQILAAEHKGTITSISWSPDGQSFVTGSEDSTLVLWNGENGQTLKRLEGHSGKVLSVAFSPDGNTIASGSEDKSIILWDVETGDQILLIDKIPGWVFGIAWSPNGDQIMGGLSNNTIVIWETTYGRPVNTMEGHSAYIKSIKLNSSGTWLASGSLDDSVFIWDIETGSLEQTINEFPGDVNSVTWTVDNQYLLVGSTNSIMICDPANGEIITSITGNHGAGISIDISSDGSTLASGSEDGTIILWDMTKLID